MTIALPRAVIFDWDNTLVDSWGAIMCAINETFTAFDKPQWTLEEVRKKCNRSARETFPEWFGIKDWKKAYDFFYARFDVARQKFGPQPHIDAEECLKWFKKHNIPCFVVSNKRTDYLEIECKALEWDAYFVKLVGSGTAKQDKPARDPVDLALGTNGLIAGHDIWFVGDSNIDMQCARNADCTPVFIGDKAEAEQLKIEWAFEDCQLFCDWLEKVSTSS